jgi:hypothetical protein
MAPDLDDLAARFRRFAARECRGLSPLYEALAEAIAEDPDVLALAAAARPGQPVPNLFLAAVHDLLLADAGAAPLAAFYPSLTAAPAPPTAAWSAFRDFALARREAIAERLDARAVNTNEVGRAACLMPAFARVARRQTRGPLHFVEIGASAGLLLAWDRYGYDYGGGRPVWNAGAPLVLACDLRRGAPDLDLGDDRFGRRIGIDRHAIDARRAEDRRWLRALVWPDQPARLARLDAALELLAEEPPELLAGDGVALLDEVAAGLPAGEPVCVYHAFTRNQFDAETDRRFEETLRRIAASRPLAQVSLEWEAGLAPSLRLVDFNSDTPPILLARADAHGAWLDWLVD